MSNALPLVTVLLATYNGERFLDEQLDSILGQTGVEVRVIALDDESTDSTPEILRARAATDARVSVLEGQGRSGGAAPNFYRLIRALDVDSAGLVAFADQDDIWLPGKLERHARFIAEGADGVSSNVTAFSDDGSRILIKKDFEQRRFDFLLEGPGPGCTFLMSPRLIAAVRALLVDPASGASAAEYHDWLLYVVCRSLGYSWVIDAEPTVDYRQHSSNVIGANVGAASAKRRLSLIASRWHRGQAALLTRVGLEVAPERDDLREMLFLFEHPGPRGRAGLLRVSSELRRRPRDRAIIGTLVALGIW